MIHVIWYMLHGELRLRPTAYVSKCHVQHKKVSTCGKRLITPLSAKDEAYVYKGFSARIVRG